MTIAPAMTPMQDNRPPPGAPPLDVQVMPDGYDPNAPSDMPPEEPQIRSVRRPSRQPRRVP